MDEKEKAATLKRLRQEEDEKTARQRKREEGDGDDDLKAAVGELVTELKADRAAREKTPALTRAKMTTREKSAYIKQHGMDKFLELPAR